MNPDEALAAARAAAARARERGAYDDNLAGFAIEPSDRVSLEQLMDWAVIEPDVTLMRSTRRLGAPITGLKRVLLRFLQQYHNEANSQQTRFNFHVMIHLAELEDRMRRIEERQGTPDAEDA